jgi:FeS assembly SUF system protein
MSEDLRNRVVDVLKTVYDPEIPVNIYELGLIYDLQVTPEGEVVVKMTLTAPNCPVADSMPAQVKQRISRLDGVTSVRVDLVFEPPWDRSKMSEAALFALGFDMGPSVVPLSKIR